jgi:hypothetical protein
VPGLGPKDVDIFDPYDGYAPTRHLVQKYPILVQSGVL